MYTMANVVGTIMLTSLMACTARADIVGTYKCVGHDSDGTQYQGIVNITPQGQAYSVEWTIGGRRHSGIGIVVDGLLCVTWRLHGTETGGVVVYRPSRDFTRLDGLWTTTSGARL